MKFRTLALALALCCGLTAIGEAKQKPAVRRAYKAKKVKPVKSGKVRAGKFKAPKRIAKKRAVKH
jgi:hypothetical protein